jgi:hypothetical protein
MSALRSKSELVDRAKQAIRSCARLSQPAVLSLEGFLFRTWRKRLGLFAEGFCFIAKPFFK